KEEKDVEFDNASFGSIQLQTVFGALGNCSEFQLDTIVDVLSRRSRAIAEIKENPIEVGNQADLTFFVHEKKWIFEKSTVISNTYNTNLIGKELNGFVAGIVNNGKITIKTNINN